MYFANNILIVTQITVQCKFLRRYFTSDRRHLPKKFILIFP
jgi:hypothetical protein